MIGLFHVLTRQYFRMFAAVPGFERPNHPPAKNKFHSSLRILERDSEHRKDIPQCAFTKALLTSKYKVSFFLYFSCHQSGEQRKLLSSLENLFLKTNTKGSSGELMLFGICAFEFSRLLN